MEPTPEEVSSWTSLLDVCRWAGLGGDPADAGTALGSFLKVLGSNGSDHWRVLAFMPKERFQQLLSQWDAAGAAPSPIQLTQAGLVGFGARVAGGTEKSQVQIATPPTTVTVSTKKARSFKLGDVVDQTLDGDGEYLDHDELAKAFRNYKAKLGADPPPDCEPSGDQLAAVKMLLDDNLPPYIDLSIFGPFSARLREKLKFQGLLLNDKGELVKAELFGPESYEQWLRNFKVLRTCLVMLQAVEPAVIDMYIDRVAELNRRYGQDCWAVVYQADVRCRREHFERLRRRAAEHKSHDAGYPYDPSNPWNH
eukprot:6456403-Amphidinium_carterae.1